MINAFIGKSLSKVGGQTATLLESQEAELLMLKINHIEICRNYFFAIPNGGFRNKREAKNLVLQGVKKGVSDYFLAYPCSGFFGLWIELKRNYGRAKPTEAQKKWISDMISFGYDAKVCWGHQEAYQKIMEYLSIIGNNQIAGH